MSDLDFQTALYEYLRTCQNSNMLTLFEKGTPCPEMSRKEKILVCDAFYAGASFVMRKYGVDLPEYPISKKPAPPTPANC